jgi:hypothetical protein
MLWKTKRIPFFLILAMVEVIVDKKEKKFLGHFFFGSQKWVRAPKAAWSVNKSGVWFGTGTTQPEQPPCPWTGARSPCSVRPLGCVWF